MDGIDWMDVRHEMNGIFFQPLIVRYFRVEVSKLANVSYHDQVPGGGFVPSCPPLGGLSRILLRRTQKGGQNRNSYKRDDDIGYSSGHGLGPDNY
jgi:hypothetical protein